MKKIFILPLLCLPFMLSAQHNAAAERITWASEQTILNDTLYQLARTVITDPAEMKITVSQNNRERTFTILSIEGTWTDVSSIGKIIFHARLNENENEAVFTIERTASEIYIRMEFDPGDTRKIIVNNIITQ